MTTTRITLGVLGLALAVGAAPAEPRNTEVGPPELSRWIDQQIDAKLTAKKVTPAPPADDAEFLRRVYLDLTGVIPSADTAAAFLKSRDPEKRAKLIDELLASPRYGKHQAETWETLLMIRDSTNRRLKSDPFVDWLTKRFNDNTPWNKLVSDLLTVTGTQEESGAATFFIALRTPDKINDQVCRLFLGVRLECAQCHDHPFAPWKRKDYWSMAAFFSKVRAGGKKVGKGEPEVVNERGQGKKTPLPDSALDLAPKFLGGEVPKLSAGAPYRPALAQWLTTAENPFFARAMVNRTWAQFFARGLVEPVDSINDSDAATHPELFKELTVQFTSSGFDLKRLIRGICNSRAYQRASGTTSEDAASDGLYARMAVKPLTPEQLYDSLSLVLGTRAETGREARKAAKQAANPYGPKSPRAKFIAFFDTPDGADPTEYATGIPQVLQLMNAPEMNEGAVLIDDALAQSRNPAEAVDRLYLATLSRYPTKAERARVDAFFKQGARPPREALADLLWVLLNTSEFTLNH